MYDHSTYTLIVEKKITFFSSNITMSANNISFGDRKITKRDFNKNKKISMIDDIDVNKILVSKEEPYDTKNSFK